MGATPIVVTGHWYTPTGGNSIGSVSFTPTDEFYQAGWATVPATEAIVPLVQGQLSTNNAPIGVTLWANDDPLTLPKGTGYVVVEQIGDDPPNEYAVVVPHSAMGGTVDLTTLPHQAILPASSVVFGGLAGQPGPPGSPGANGTTTVTGGGDFVPTGVDWTGATDSTSALNTAIVSALIVGAPQIVLAIGSVLVNSGAVHLNPLPPGIGFRGADMGLVNDITGAWVSGTTLIDGGTRSSLPALLTAQDTGFPGPNGTGVGATLSTGGRIENLTLSGIFAGTGKIGLQVDRLLNQTCRNVRVQHYNDGGAWSPTATYTAGQLVTFFGNSFTSIAGSNTNNLPAFSGTANAHWTYVAPQLVWNSSGASVGVLIKSLAAGGFAEKMHSRNLVVEDCTRGVVGTCLSAGASIEYNDLGIVFLQGPGQSGVELTGASSSTADQLNANHMRWTIRGNFYSGPASSGATPPPIIGIGADGSSVTALGTIIDLQCENNGNTAWSNVTAYTVGKRVVNSGNQIVCIGANTNQAPPGVGAANAYWANLGPSAKPQTLNVGANAFFTGNGSLVYGGGQASTIGPFPGATPSGSFAWYGWVVGDSTIPESTNPNTVTLVGLVGDNGLTDNYAGGFQGGSQLDIQLTLISINGGGVAEIPAQAGYIGISSEITASNYPGVQFLGRGAGKLKSPGAGTMTFGSGFGPYIGSGGSNFLHAVMVLDTPGATIDNLALIGINGTNSTTFLESAPAACWITGSSTSTATRQRNCSFLGGIVSSVIMDTGSDDNFSLNNFMNNGSYNATWSWGYNNATPTVVGNISPTGTIRGMNLIVGAAADHRWIEPQSLNGPWRVGFNTTNGTLPWGTIAGGGNDDIILGGHISSPSGANPTQTNLFHLYLDSSTGGSFTNMTLDNGNSGGDLQAYVHRVQGHWKFSDCRIQTGNTTYGYPIFEDAGTDLNHGFQVKGLHISPSGSPVPFTGLLNMLGGTANSNNSFEDVAIDSNGAVLGPYTTLWLAAGSPTTTILPGRARNIYQEGNPAIFFPDIGDPGWVGYPFAVPVLPTHATYVLVKTTISGWTWTSGGSATVTPASTISLVDLQGGMQVSGNNVPPNTFAKSINRTAGTVTLTNATTAGTGGSLTFAGMLPSTKTTLQAARIQPNAPGNTESPWGLIGINAGGPPLWSAAGCTIASSGGSTTITIPFNVHFDASALNVGQPVTAAGIPAAATIGSITDDFHVVLPVTSTPGTNITVTFGNDTLLAADSSWDPTLGSFWRTPGGSSGVGVAPTDWTLDGVSGLTLPDYLTASGFTAAPGDPAIASSTITLASGTLYLCRVVAFAGSWTQAYILSTVKGVIGSTGVGGAELFIFTLPLAGGPPVVYGNVLNVDGALTGAVTGGGAPTPQAINLSGTIAGFTIGQPYWVGIWIPTNWANGSGAVYPILSAPSVAGAAAANVFNDRFATFATGSAPTSLPAYVAGQSPWIGLK